MFPFFTWLDQHPLFWPLFIFFARIADVPIGTVRTICVVRGFRLLASGLGFLEVLIWLTAISGIFRHLDNWVNIVAYGLGFATGNYIGIHLEEHLALGYQVVRLISHNSNFARLTEHLRTAGYRLTEIPATDGTHPVHLCFLVVPRKRAPQAVQMALATDPEVFITVEDVRYSNLGTYPNATKMIGWRAIGKKK